MIHKKQTEHFQVVRVTKEAFGNSLFRLSFLGYKDYCDNQTFFLKEFTTEIIQVTSFVQAMRASGGGDSPEALLGALRLAHKYSIFLLFLNFSSVFHGLLHQN